MDNHLNVNVKDSVRISKRNPYAAHSQKKSSESSSVSAEQLRKIIIKNQKLKTKKLKKRAKAPKKLIVTCAILLALAITAHFYHDPIDQFLSRIELGIFSQGLAQSAAKSSTPVNANANKIPSAKSPEPIAATKDKATWTAEEINIFKGLDSRKKQLDEKEKSLNTLAEELQRQRVDLDEKLKRLEETRSEITKALGEQIEKDEEKLNKLVEVYSNMKPQSAAKVFDSIDENLAVDVLSRMKKDKAANILNLIEPLKARRLSEKFAGYVRK